MGQPPKVPCTAACSNKRNPRGKKGAGHLGVVGVRELVGALREASLARLRDIALRQVGLRRVRLGARPPGADVFEH